jgi:hypothetical protein
MRKGIKKLLFLISPILIISCSKLDQKSYVQWVQDVDNGLHVKKEIGEFVFDIQYLPLDYMWLQYKNGSREDLKGLQYYALTISPKESQKDFIEGGASSEADKQRKLYYFSYSFQSSILLEENKKQSPCVLYHFERPIDLKNGRTFMLGFEEEFPDSKEAKLVIDSQYFGSLPIKIKISKDNVPTLAL